MINTYKYKDITWIDSQSPTTEEIETLMEGYRLNPKVARDLLLATYKDTITLYDDYIYMILHFPAIRHSHKKEKQQEIDFVLGKNFIITNKYEIIDELEKFAKEFEVNSILKSQNMRDHAGYVFYYIMKGLYSSMHDELESLGDQIKETEQNIFIGKEKEMVNTISQITRELMNFEHTIKPHKEILEKFKNIYTKFFDKDFIENIQKLIDEHKKIKDTLTDAFDSIRELRETNTNLLSTKQNEIMKILTIFTCFALPFSVITGFFQMNTKLTPLVDNTYAWPIIVGVEIVIAILLFFFAKRKHWF
ncbi:MAG: CorA family divalent cation transporter [Minisyncoccia bacterium]